QAPAKCAGRQTDRTRVWPRPSLSDYTGLEIQHAGNFMRAHIAPTLLEAADYLHRFIANPFNLESIDRAATVLIEALENGNAIYSCGNGGSMSDAMHFAEELTGRYRNNRPGLAAT